MQLGIGCDHDMEADEIQTRTGNQHALGGAVDLIEHEAMQMNVEIGGRVETLNQCDGASCGFDAFESGLLDQKCGNDPVDDLQDGREQLRMRSEQQAKGIGNESTHWRTGTRGMT
jgi:hypothetical protein